MTSDPSDYHRLSPVDSYSLFQFERSDVISVLKNSIDYNFLFFLSRQFFHLKALVIDVPPT